MVSQHNWRIEIYTLHDGASGILTSNYFVPETFDSLDGANEAADKICMETRASGFNIFQAEKVAYQ